MFKMALENGKKYKALFIMYTGKWRKPKKSVYAPIINKGLPLCQSHEVQNILVKWESQILSS